MKYTDLSIQTQREEPNNARTQGFAFLARAGYVTRENQPTPLGEFTLRHLEKLSVDLGDSFFKKLDIPFVSNEEETFFPLETGALEIIHCLACGYAAKSEVALFAKSASPGEVPLSIEKVATPECNTIDDLANFLEIPKDKTAKALLFTRQSDGKFVFTVVRGDMQLSEAKLVAQVGEVKPAIAEEIIAADAVAGYASPIGLRDSLIIVDDLIPESPNLVAGANETGYHLKNVNYGRDYSAEIIADLVQAEEGYSCAKCGKSLTVLLTDLLASKDMYHFERILHALAESHHDEYGLTLPHPTAPFDVYLMHIPSKMMDTEAVTIELYEKLHAANISVLLDVRNTRAGVKFNDADLIGCPIRITIGERGLQNGRVELKPRSAAEKTLVPLDKIVKETQNLL